jgi:hypothetical protein
MAIAVLGIARTTGIFSPKIGYNRYQRVLARIQRGRNVFEQSVDLTRLDRHDDDGRIANRLRIVLLDHEPFGGERLHVLHSSPGERDVLRGKRPGLREPTRNRRADVPGAQDR